MGRKPTVGKEKIQEAALRVFLKKVMMIHLCVILLKKRIVL